MSLLIYSLLHASWHSTFFFFSDLSDGLPIALVGSFLGLGVGPIFLDRLNCDGNENNLLNCSSERSHGVTSCTHAMDVAVRCPGIVHT